MSKFPYTGRFVTCVSRSSKLDVEQERLHIFWNGYDEEAFDSLTRRFYSEDEEKQEYLMRKLLTEAKDEKNFKPARGLNLVDWFRTAHSWTNFISAQRALFVTSDPRTKQSYGSKEAPTPRKPSTRPVLRFDLCKPGGLLPEEPPYGIPHVIQSQREVFGGRFLRFSLILSAYRRQLIDEQSLFSSWHALFQKVGIGWGGGWGTDGMYQQDAGAMKAVCEACEDLLQGMRERIIPRSDDRCLQGDMK